MSNVDIYPFLYVVRRQPIVKISNDQDFLGIINSMNRAGKNKFIRITPEFLKNLVIKDGKLTRKDLYTAICKRGKSNRSSEFYIFMGHDTEFAKKIVSELQISSTNKVKTYQNKYDISFIMKKHNVSLEEATLIREARVKSAPLPSTIDYWIKRGFSETESKEKVKEHNVFAVSKLQEKDAIDPTRKIGRCSTQLEYYIKRGMNQEEAEESLSERQTTFSLDICIEKHGLEEGTKIWQARQDKWIKTLDNKTDEEKAVANQKRGIDKNGFKTTECFSKDIFGSEELFMSYFNACKLSPQFSSIQLDESLSSLQSS